MRIRVLLISAAAVMAGTLATPVAALPGPSAPVNPSPVDASAVARSLEAWAAVTGVEEAERAALVDPLAGASVALDRPALADVLRLAPAEDAGRALMVAVPAPDGTSQRFAVRSSPVLEPGLAARHPEIRTFAGRGVDDPTATIRMSLTPLGFHASVHADGRAWYVDPRFRGDDRLHVAYERTALPVPEGVHVKNEPVVEDVHAEVEAEGTAGAGSSPPSVPLRVYRLALVTDPTYARNSGAADGLDPTAPDYDEQLNDRVTAAKAVMVNRVNQVYEADMGVRMILIDATDRLNLNTAAQATGAGGPCGVDPCFTSSQVTSCSSGGLTRNSIVTGLLAGARNFDIGHLALGTDGGGIAQLGVVGDTNKARGCTGLKKPIGDFFAIDYVAHEMGHQFAANHTFNGTLGACAGLNRNLTGATAVEPGSGSSVMAYAGICALDDLQAHTDPYFSHASITEMTTYVQGGTSRSSVQLVVLRGFDGTDSYTLGYGERRTATITRGVDHSAAGIKQALEAVLPPGGTVTVTEVTDKGLTVTFGGALAGSGDVPLLDVAPVGATGFVGETVAGGPTRRGGTPIDSENTAPEVTAPAELVIPERTPFTLTAQGRDADGDSLTYLWEQADAGLPAVGSSLLEPVRAVGPLFRVFGTAARYAHPDDTYLSPSPGQNLAGTDPSRTFPDLAQVVAGNTNAQTGWCPSSVSPASETSVDCLSEQLPTASWAGGDGRGTLRFRVTVRDNHPGAGGTATADTVLRVAKGAGPFRVLDGPGGNLPTAAGTLAVVWDVARTDVLVGTTQVRISLSTDGGRTFPHVLAAATANDGTETVALPPGLSTTTGRIKVEAVGNVFFDVNRTDLALTTPGR